MPTRARSGSDAAGSAGRAGNQTTAGDQSASEPNSADSTAQAEAGAARHQPQSGRPQGFMAGFQVPLPGMGNVDPLRLLWLGGLAALATIEIIEWPVALTLGAGSYIAERLARQDILQDLSART